MRNRPALFVLAGVNGAGKSSALGAVLREHGFDWFNPDAFSRELLRAGSLAKSAADAAAWNYGRERLEAAIADGTSFAFETTLGGRTITRLIERATATHDVTMMFCGLDTVERHIARVRLRTRHGGHDIPEQRIRQRWSSAPLNLIMLMPKLNALQVFDNSREAKPGQPIPLPSLILEMQAGRMTYPKAGDPAALARTPQWAKALLESALKIDAANAKPRHQV